MKLSEYLQHRGGNNITVAEAHAIGLVINPGWPQKYASKEIPENLAEAVLTTKHMPWVKRRKFLKDVCSDKSVTRANSMDFSRLNLPTQGYRVEFEEFYGGWQCRVFSSGLSMGIDESACGCSTPESAFEKLVIKMQKRLVAT